MPRLPTIRVIGSQDISTTFGTLPATGVPSWGIRLAMAPDGLGVVRGLSVLAQFADGAAVGPDGLGGQLGAGGLVEERRLHELVGEAGHGATDADPADVGAAAQAVHPAALADVTLYHRPPAADLDDALARAGRGREVGLLVVAGPVAALVNGLAEQPGRSQPVVQG